MPLCGGLCLKEVFIFLWRVGLKIGAQEEKVDVVCESCWGIMQRGDCGGWGERSKKGTKQEKVKITHGEVHFTLRRPKGRCLRNPRIELER